MSEFKLNIVLYRPEIPQNTGSIGRLCVNLGVALHLVKPLGFSLDEKQVRRAGLDYWSKLDLTVHDNWEAFLDTMQPENLVFASTKGRRDYFEWEFANDAFIVFGSESCGLPDAMYDEYADVLYCVPMPGDACRSLNLSNTAAIIAYEAYRQFSRS